MRITHDDIKRFDDRVENEALVRMQGRTFDMMDFVLEKVIVRQELIDLKAKHKTVFETIYHRS